MPKGKTVPFVAVSIAFMLFAVIIGIFRMMAQSEIGPVMLSQLYTLHPVLMVFGFIAGIIVTERVAGIELLPHSRETRVSMAMPPMLFIGVVLEAGGYLFDSTLVRYVGGSMLVAASLLFIWLLWSFLALGREKVSMLFMLVSALALLSAAVLSAFSLPSGNVGFVMLLLSFPVVFVLGERVELTSLATQTSSRRFVPSFLMSAAAVALFGIGSLDPTEVRFETAGFALLALVFAIFLVAERRIPPGRSDSLFQRYVRSHVALAYVWGFVGSVFGVVYSLVGLFASYDAFVHSIALGFVGLMFLAHGPIILPMVVRKQFDYTKLSYVPAGMLTIALTARIGAESALASGYSLLFGLAASASGWLVLAAALAFFAEIFTGTTTSGRPEAQSPRLLPEAFTRAP